MAELNRRGLLAVEAVAEAASTDAVLPEAISDTPQALKFSFDSARSRIASGGWVREVTARELPAATQLAGVNMRLKPGAIRELHWHEAAEWAYVLAGRARITAVDPQGRNFADDVGEGDLWTFPAGIPHSIQALHDDLELLLVFDDAEFSENATFEVTDWLANMPREILAKTLGIPDTALADLPTDVERTRYLFGAPVPGVLASDTVTSPQGAVADGYISYSHRLTTQKPIEADGGRMRTFDSSNFPAAGTIAGALVEIEPGGVREPHWHPHNADEWQYYISGRGRMGVFAPDGTSGAFDYEAGDVGCVPSPMGHYVENTGDETLRYLELFRSDHLADVSLNQWLALTPPDLLRAHLNVDPHTLAGLSKRKPNLIR